MRLYRGHILNEIKHIASNSVHVIVTSPPYWRLRAYGTEPQVWMMNSLPLCEKHEWGREILKTDMRGIARRFDRSSNFCLRCHAWRGELGLEPTPEMYIRHMVEIFRELKRVLRDDGTLWLNLGDKYASNWSTSRQNIIGNGSPDSETLKNTDLVGIPWSVAFALRADGWYLRSDCIWYKRSAMPESINGWQWERHRVKVVNASNYQSKDKLKKRTNTGSTAIQPAEWRDCDGCEKCEKHNGLILRKSSWRPTKAHEYVFLLSKSEDYFCDKEAVKESASDNPSSVLRRAGKPRTVSPKQKLTPTGVKANASMATKIGEYLEFRNLRTVWDITTAPYAGAHFATFPPRLPEIAIKAGTSQRGCCAGCGAPWARVVNKPQPERHETESSDVAKHGRDAHRSKHTKVHQPGTSGWLPTCDCNAGEPVPCTVLDPFAGSGTTLEVAERMGRNAVGIELKDEYAEKHIEKRMENVNPLFAKPQ